ncbi:Dyp-type peroxidase domain-containing protein [Piscinibacter gummiphilus]|uniref:Dyp-type peroxidase n=1 Tax=Piscinibacter gummiphilus TaxID=946333 RepID=A0ABZ0CZU8_9BURK|nr:Dyp-type peroxidase domain-containing protein [Piscinibacter gummiphilus]WOB08487.1 Dyp-type peroxidase [Piscinibacter gummiphilus]
MYQVPPTKTKSLLGTSDLTLVATIKTGFAPAYDARSYQSRLRILLTTLSAGRTSSQEAQPTPLIEDAIDRIRAIHSFRLAFIGDPFKPQLLLAVTFDGGWEPYMRHIWRDLGPLLDVIFCNCDGYLTSCNHSYGEYIAWVRSAQVGTEFVYTASPLTVDDLHYFRDREQGRLLPLASKPAPAPPAGPALLEQAWPALTTVYRLADMYLPQGAPKPHDDADVLLLAARLFLASALPALKQASPKGRLPSEQAALKWVLGLTEAEKQAQAQKPVAAPTPSVFQPDKAQGGIVVDQYLEMTHGCVVLIELKNAAAAQALLEYLEPRVTRGSTPIPAGNLVTPCLNVAFTLEGLRVAGVPAGTLECMPIEFREGMAARASILGDVDYNHPTRWTLPEVNWPIPTPPGQRVEMSSVHVIVQLATRRVPSSTFDDFFAHPQPATPHPLLADVVRLGQCGAGVRILSVQPTQRYIAAFNAKTYGHFRYVDGLSQPTVGGAEPAGPGYPNHVPLGDVLLGYENSRKDPPLRGPLWDDSTFVVIRKLRQYVDRFDNLLNRSTLPKGKAEELLMGRKPNGDNLVMPATANGFNYGIDPDAKKCPFQSHVRRSNPRTSGVPRIIRRGMSYGPQYSVQPGTERGLMFTAYNASITEQFEVIQGWLSGGNANGSQAYSGLRDPFLGVCAAGDPQRFAFDGGALALDPAEPLVTLEWGLYAFVPSIDALKELWQRARDAATQKTVSTCPYHLAQTDEDRKRERTALALKGAAVINGLQLIERMQGIEAAKTQWKIMLEDFATRMSGVSRAVWAGVRELHGGVLKTPYGVLVCDRLRVREVYENSQGRYTVAGYNERLRSSIGEIYLGLDDKAQHDLADSGVNAAIYAVTEQQAFDVAYQSMTSTVAKFLPAAGQAVTIEVKDLVDEALAEVCKPWFGIPDGTYVAPGGWSVGATAVTCPGNFHPPSRYTFQPNPGPEIAAAGKDEGKALRNKVAQLVRANLAAIQQSRLGKAIDAAAVVATAAAPNTKDDLLVRNLVGAMMGMLPTVDGNLRGVLFEWVKDLSLWDHQLHYRQYPALAPYDRAVAALLPPLTSTMQLRPAPELVWRSARQAHDLGGVPVAAGETVVVSIVSAMQQNQLRVQVDDGYTPVDDKDPLWPVFGGLRGEPKWTTPEPLHACPGYKMAMGTLLGLLAGLLENHTWRPTLSPTTLKLYR